MRRTLSFAAALAAVAAIGVVATPAEAQTAPPQPEVRDVPVTEADEPATPGFEEEVEVTNDEVGLVGLKWDGDEAPVFKVTVQNEDGEWEEVEPPQTPDGGPDPGTEEAQRVEERRDAEHVSEPIAVEDPSKVRVEVEGGTAENVELVTVTTPSSDDELDEELGAEPDQAGVLPRTVAVVALAGLAIALVLPGNRRRISSGAMLSVLVVGFGVLATACVPFPENPPPRPHIISRAAWGANEGLRNCGPQYASSVDMGIVHHTVNSNSYSPGQAPGLVRGIYAFHTDGHGWCDIGYNFLVDRYGRIYEGRYGGITRPVIGAHAAPFNTRTFGTAVIGNFETGGPTTAALNGLIRLFRWKLTVHNVNPYGGVHINGGWYDPIVGHRDVNQTACPGAHLYSRLPGLRDAIKPHVFYGTPFGDINRASRDGTKVRVQGWALDPDTWKPINIHVYVGGPYGVGRGVYFGPANVHRPDVGAAYGKASAHGFNLVLPAFGPRNEVCVYPQNVGPGGNSPLIGCARYPADPIGDINRARRDGTKVRVQGWALDPDTAQPTGIHVYMGGPYGIGTGVYFGPADVSRPDVSAAYPGMGDNHGFNLVQPVFGPRNEVCVYPQNVGPGNNSPLIGCKSFRVDPRGHLEVATRSGSTIRVKGWALDHDTQDGIRIRVFLDGVHLETGRADEFRPDVGAAYPGMGDNHGFDFEVEGGPGTLCVQMVNEGMGSVVYFPCLAI